MLTLSLVPAAPLSEFVGMLWFYDGYSQPHAKERLLPEGSAELVINLDQDLVRIYDREDHNRHHTLRGSVICGPHSEYFVIDTSGQRSVIGVHFQPGGLAPFIGLPADELRNRHVSLEDIWGRAAGELREGLLDAATPAAKFALLERALLARASGRLRRHPAVAYALREMNRAAAPPALTRISETIGLSARRFSGVFAEEVGLSPKLYARVQRFQGVLHKMSTPPVGGIDWIGIALSCGYYDQAHFIHDFRAFSGLTPTHYVAQRTPHFNHVPLHD